MEFRHLVSSLPLLVLKNEITWTNILLSTRKTVSQCEDLKQKYSEEQAKRKELYNYIQETKGNECLTFPDDLL